MKKCTNYIYQNILNTGTEFTKMFPLLAIFVMNPNNSIDNNWSDKNMMNKKIIGVMALAVMMIVGVCPAFAATSSTATQSVTVKVNPTVAIAVNSPLDFGALDADGSSATRTTTVTSTSNVAIDVWTKATDFTYTGTETSDLLNLSDFTYGASSTAFTTDYAKCLSNIAKAPKKGSTLATLDLKITAPVGTSAGTYDTSVTYTAVQKDAAKPA